MTKLEEGITKKVQGNGFAIYKLVAYFETEDEMRKYLRKPFRMKNDNEKQVYTTRYVMYWGTQYDKIPKFRKGLRTH